jgi:UDP-N-acetylmuramyl pentapeptide phosphotransferase/UDP-N-acetylglucosamine-1-phosphate transferase
MLTNYLLILFSFSVSFVVVFISIPSIVKVAESKGLFDKPNQRKSHNGNIPTLGGIATFAAIIISMTLFLNTGDNPELLYLIGSMTILFFIGIKDDILMIAPDKKLIGQLLAISIMVLLGNIRFTNLHGFLGIYELNYITSVLLTAFVMVVVINAFNLIDGIDGLASGIGILISLAFGLWFYLTGYYNYAVLSAAIAGSYLSFFGYNVFGKRNKIFMGDTGSLVLGFVISLLVIQFNEANINYSGKYSFHAAPAVSFGVLIIPMFDTLRVFLLRILKGRSPFMPDKNHLHHRLLLLGFTHAEATLIFASVNIFFIVLMVSLKSMELIPLMLINISVALFFMLLTELFIYMQQHRDQNFNSNYNRYQNDYPAKSA